MKTTPYSLRRLSFYISCLIVAYILMCLWRPARGQGIQTLAVGDTIPDVQISHMLNYQSTRAKLSDFRGKLLILDFWATWCAPCIYMIPRMDSIQEHFGGKVQFLAVTREPESKVASFRAKYDKRHGKRILHPEVVSDTRLSGLFPHNTYPHYVWIDSGGIVRAITEMDQITEAKIASFLAENKPALTEKRDEPRVPFDPAKPLLTDGNGGDGSNLIYHSVLTSYSAGLAPRFSWKIDPKAGRKITLTNCSRNWLYRVAYAEPGGFLDDGSVVIESDKADGITSSLYGQAFTDWLKAGNGFCYELIVPASFQQKTNAIMQQDLANFFPQYAAAMENRTQRCLALVRLQDKQHILKTSPGGRTRVSIDPFSWKVTNASLSLLVTRFNQTQNYPLHLVDQTGFTSPVDMEIEGNISDMEGLNKALSHYGLRLQEQIVDRPVLVIRDRKEMTTK